MAPRRAGRRRAGTRPSGRARRRNGVSCRGSGSTLEGVCAHGSVRGARGAVGGGRTARYAVDRVTPKSSSSSLTVCSPARYGSVGSCTEVPSASVTSRAVSSSAIARASGSDRASRSSLVTTSSSPARHAASACRSPRRSRRGAGEAVVDVDALGLNAARPEGVALGGEVLRIGEDAGVVDLQSRHDPKYVPFVGRSPAHITEPPLRHTRRRVAGEVAAQRDGCAGGGSASGISVRRRQWPYDRLDRPRR
jgi:hypothetical protein